MKSKLLKLTFFLFLLTTVQLTFSAELKEQDQWKRVYLATYPRSGNHWVRYLIEEATHIATSSVYCDPDPQHLKEPFPWGGFCCDHGYEGHCRYPTQDDLVVVKTHLPGQNRITPYDNLDYELAIRIVRNPVDSFYSRYINLYGKKQGIVPTKVVQDFIQSWSRFQRHWNNQKNVITIRYEDMLENPSLELAKILQAIHYEATDEDIARAVTKYPPQGGELKHLDKFSHEDLKLISLKLTELLNQFDYTIPY